MLTVDSSFGALKNSRLAGNAGMIVSDGLKIFSKAVISGRVIDLSDEHPEKAFEFYEKAKKVHFYIQKIER